MKENLKSSVITVICFVSFAALTFAETKPSKPFPKWDKQIKTTERFKVLDDFNEEAVLDNETGLVWQRSLSSSFTVNWFDTQSPCVFASTGGRMGWRVPTIEELSSLIDLTQSNPALPNGHPFVNVQFSQGYWSSTGDTTSDTRGWVVNFDSGFPEVDLKGVPQFLWCVRDGQGQ